MTCLIIVIMLYLMLEESRSLFLFYNIANNNLVTDDGSCNYNYNNYHNTQQNRFR